MHVDLESWPFLVCSVSRSRSICPETGTELLRWLPSPPFTSEQLSIFFSSPFSGHPSEVVKLPVPDSARQDLILLHPGSLLKVLLFVPTISVNQRMILSLTLFSSVSAVRVGVGCMLHQFHVFIQLLYSPFLGFSTKVTYIWRTELLLYVKICLTLSVA